MSGNHLFGLIRKHMPGNPAEARFCELPDGRVYTYQDVLDVSGRFANVLVELGVKPGDRVAVQVPKSIEALMLYLGAVRAGAVFLPLNTAYTRNEIAYFLKDAEPAVFVADPKRADEMRDVAGECGVPQFETLGVWRKPGAGETDAGTGGTLAAAGLAASPGFTDVPRAKDDLAAILYTSGTTGRSKGAMLTHECLASNAEALVEHWQFTSEDVLIHGLPIFHTHGLFVATNTILLAGGSMIFLPGFNAETFIELLPRATSMMGVPTFYTRLLQRPELNHELVKNMRLFVSGSAPLSAETHKEWSERTGHAILERYGMTETNMNTSNPYDGERRPGTVGMALPGVSLRIANPETGEVLKQGDVGVIEVKGPNVFKGYWRNPEKTAEEFRGDRFFITGDLAFIDDDGYVHIVGRAKDLVISGGFNVYPAEVEAEIDALPGVAESAVIGLPHADFGEGVTAVVAPRPGADLSEESIRSALETALAKYKVPKRVFVVDSLPRNTMGKIQKNVLRETYKDTYSEDAA
ncbi:MAG: malonyl-CoA synthase [Rhodobiaceae bacterium]|nr:malonyl-CoA synthase [Rhodobiaceae bacterium]MCC0048389.1 malonyl-CoA synthase [Rhodobiaceae bacterium]